MSVPVSIITPSHAGDFAACRLLCETLDAYVTGVDAHYIVVGASDLAQFAELAGPRRHIVDEATLLPRTLVRVPVKWKGRRYRWAPGILPVYGWHIQQVLKFAMTLAQPHPRVMFIDSDNFFVRPFDLATYAGGDTIPLQIEREAATDASYHGKWLRNAHALLGLPAPTLPGDDFVGQMIVWDVEWVRTIVSRIEANCGVAWWKALLRARDFSEYMIYGVAVCADAAVRARHHPLGESPCLSYWEGPALGQKELSLMLQQLGPDQSALGIQSFTRTPNDLLRAAAFPQKSLA